MNLALNVSMSFDTVNAFPSSYDEREIKAMHRLGTLAHFAPWVLDGLCRSVPGSKAMLTNVVRMLNERTFYMRKPFEAATIRSLLFGQASMGQCSCGAGARATVTRALANLVKHGILVKIECHGCPTMYSLNIPNLIEHIRKMIAATPAENANTRVRDMRDRWAEIESEIPMLMNAYARTMALVQSTVESLVHLRKKAPEILVQAVSVVEEKAIAVVKEVAEVVVEKVEKAKEVVMNLADAIKAVANGSQAKDAKLRKKSDQPLFDKKGKPLSHNGIACWDRVAADFKYAGYEPRHFGKIYGQMKCWLAELAKRGLSEAEIRVKIFEIVMRWRHIDSNARITSTNKDGKPYHFRVDPWPHFDSFYASRDQYAGLLVAADARRVTYSKKEMEKVDFNRHNF